MCYWTPMATLSSGVQIFIGDIVDYKIDGNDVMKHLGKVSGYYLNEQVRCIAIRGTFATI